MSLFKKVQRAGRWAVSIVLNVARVTPGLQEASL